MKKVIPVLVLLCLLLSSLNVAAASPLRQTDTAPRITSFTTTMSVVDRTALIERRARVPVSWTTANRPFIANLFFEQVLPDGSAVNVELPRTVPWVNSSGNGMAAPIWPGDNMTQITLRVRLVNLLTNQVYDERQLTVTIGAGDPGSGNTNRPAIARFTTCCSTVRADQLAARTARVPVSWSVVNRPATANLIFEQVLTDGSVVNVELPRDNPWVNSNGDGVAAPVAPGGSAATVRLRLRLVELLTGRVYDQRDLILTIGGTPTGEPAFRYFSTTFSNIDSAGLLARTARVPVSWAVDNRPENSNLVFEQVLPNGSIVNVELPRPNPWVSSEGNGVAAPLSPGDGIAEIVLRVRLINLTTGHTYDQRQFTLPISNVPSSGPRLLYFTTSASSVDALALAQRLARVPVSWAVINRPANANLVFEQALPGGSVVNVELPRDNPWVASEGNGVAAPVLPQNSNTVRLRLRLVNLADNTTLAASEMAIPIVGVGALPPAQADAAATAEATEESAPPGELQITSFTASPASAAPGGSITLAWNVTGATSIRIERPAADGSAAPQVVAGDLPASGTRAYSIPAEAASAITFSLVVEDANGRRQTSAVTVQVAGVEAECAYADTLTDDCPISQSRVQAAYQPFERGFMVWRGDTRQIYIFWTNGSYIQYPDTWVEGEIIDVGDAPPDGLLAPERGFGKVWLNMPAVRDNLGWATGAESGYTATLENHTAADGASSSLINLPDGRVLHLIGVDRWQVVQ